MQFPDFVSLKMPSLLPGYEYDIFISYRQKDNTYDGWVTQFVSNLKRELEATFKEPISIYFDQNSHDGLLETHDVGKSLEGKLKCLVFIPILSQTYCDPNSYAWREELCAFNRLAHNQPLGRDIRLANGNVASRILPVQIHELDPHDQAAYERETGGPPRAIPFIYRETGVNRPLLPTDARHENLNKTEYRNQVNKVANAIKDIIQSITQPNKIATSSHQRSDPKIAGNRKAAVFILLFLIVSSFIGYLLTRKKTLKEPHESGIAVLPFKNNTGDPNLDVYGIGLASAVITQFSTSNQFKFISSLQATLPYSNGTTSTREIGDALGVDYLIAGFYHQLEENVLIDAELIESATGKAIRRFTLEGKLTAMDSLHHVIAQGVMNLFADKAVVATRSTSNTEAYAHYIRGKVMMENAVVDSGSWLAPFPPIVEQFRQAINLDSGYLDAWADLINVECFMYQGDNKTPVLREAIEDHLKTFEKRFPETSWQKNMVRGQYAYRVAQDYSIAKELMADVLRENPANEHAAYALSTLHRRNLELSDALRYGIQLAKLNPAHGTHWFNLGYILELAGDGTNAMKATIKGWRLAKSRILASQLVEQALRLGFPLQELPPEIQESPYTLYFTSLARKDWASSMSSAKKLVMNNKILFYYLYKERDMEDSARYWLEQALRNSETDSIGYYTGIGDCDKARFLIEQQKGQQFQTPESQLLHETLMIECALINTNDAVATQLLRKLIQRYPEVDVTYIYRNHPFGKKVMDRNPSFKKLVTESKWKPSLHLDELP